MRVTLLGIRTALAPVAAGWLRRPAGLILRRERPYWQERGWTREGRIYRGAYQTPFGAFPGRAEERGFGLVRFYITDPPQALRTSSHWACFTSRGSGEFSVHMASRPADISSGIMTIERLLSDVLREAGR